MKQNREIGARQIKEMRKYTGKWMLPALVEDEIKWFEVSEEVYFDYLHDLDKEEKRYFRNYFERSNNEEKRQCFGNYISFPRCVSLDSIMEGGGECYLVYTEDPSEQIIEQEDRKKQLQILRREMESFTEEERRIYTHFYVEQKSEYEYERLYGIGRKTISYRKKKFLERLEKILKKSKKVFPTAA